MTLVEKLYFWVIEYRQAHHYNPPKLLLTWRDNAELAKCPTPLLENGKFMGVPIVCG